jgi:hypothetical protein
MLYLDEMVNIWLGFLLPDETKIGANLKRVIGSLIDQNSKATAVYLYTAASTL